MKLIPIYTLDEQLVGLIGGHIDLMNIKDLEKNVIEAVENIPILEKIIREATNYMSVSGSGLQYRPPGMIEIIDYDEVYVLGDLHGDYASLLEFLYKEDVVNKLNELNIKLVFLGDYVDRGPHQVETITMLLYLKTRYPEKIVLLRGNHEPPPFLIPVPHDFIDVLKYRYGEKGISIYKLFYRLFQKLPYVARIPGRILFLHGGPPASVMKAKSFEEAFSIGLLSVDDIVLEDILWSDPIDDQSIELAPSGRGAGNLYGPKITSRTLELAGVKYIVRGHEPVQGYLLSHRGRVVTLFDSRIPVYGISRAAYMKINGDHCFEDISKCILYI